MILACSNSSVTSVKIVCVNRILKSFDWLKYFLYTSCNCSMISSDVISLITLLGSKNSFIRDVKICSSKRVLFITIRVLFGNGFVTICSGFVVVFSKIIRNLKAFKGASVEMMKKNHRFTRMLG